MCCFSLNFAGSAGYNYAIVSTSNVKMDSNNTAYVRWDTSREDCKMWFQVVNSNNENRGKRLLTGISSTYKDIETSGTAQGYYYWLRASREHIMNPSNYVSGIWEP